MPALIETAQRISFSMVDKDYKIKKMIVVERIKIKNYKCFKDFEMDFNDTINIIVGNNEEGKSTILEALQLAISGMLNGRTLFADVYESLFNKESVDEYLHSLLTSDKKPLPTILIEVYLKGDDLAKLEGDGNSYKTKKCGLAYKISFNDQYNDEYNALIQTGEIKTLPVEYYKIERYSFARESVTNRSIPLKSVLIDSSSTKFQNGSDVYISKIIKDNLQEKELAALAQSFRMLKESFSKVEAIEAINRKVSENAGISNKKINVSVDMSVKNSWETVLMTYIDEIPFHQIGKGEQCIIKSNLALSHKKALTSNLILLEEPENHLSHTRLNELLETIISKCKTRQLIITTHSNFVANKLGLNNLIMLSHRKCASFNSLHSDVIKYFKKLPGYDTLRLVLSKAAILVEGPSDELIIQRAFKDNYEVLPIEKGIDVISVRGLSFKRFLEIAKNIDKKVAVITDNDSDYQQKVKEKYKEYASNECIRVFADQRNMLNTLEPQFVDANADNIDELRKIIGISKDKYPDEKAVIKYMTGNKAEWALNVFEASIKFNYPAYIIDALNWINNNE